MLDHFVRHSALIIVKSNRVKVSSIQYFQAIFNNLAQAYKSKYSIFCSIQ